MRLRILAVILGFCVVAFVFQRTFFDYPRRSVPVEVRTSAVSHLFEEHGYDVVVRPGHFAWTESRLCARPVSEHGVTIHAYRYAACLDNGSRQVRLPDRTPSVVIRVPREQGERVAWNARERQLTVSTDNCGEVSCYGPIRTVYVPYHSCYVARADMFSMNFMDCTALALFNGDWAIFAHCPHYEAPRQVTSHNVLDRVRPLMRRKEGEWKACIAGLPEHIRKLSSGLRALGVPVVQAVETDVAAHSVFFSRRMRRLTVVPTQYIVRHE